MKSQTIQRQNQQSHSASHRDEQFVRQRAYELYLQRGQEPGHELEDWLQAERETEQPEQWHNHQKAA